MLTIHSCSTMDQDSLAKNLRKVLPNSHILHQDDFAPKSEEIPIHPVHGVPDWDDPRGASVVFQ
jgi:nicotinamide/nicotinate riboside kinase